jgi:tetratricopeptide (TPR) repeat protein
MGNFIARLFILAIAQSATILGLGQAVPITEQAVQLCEQEEWTGAKQKIAEALLTAESKTAFCWYVDGYIHKELYKLHETGLQNSTLRTRAVESFMKAIDLDMHNEHSKMAKLGLKYLASTYYNDALMLTQSFQMNHENEPAILFDKFKSLMQVADPRTGIVRFNQEFERNMGQRLYQLWAEDINKSELPAKIIERYSKVLTLDSNDVDAWYNISVVYYNQAVFKYRSLDSKTDIFDLVTIQQECSDLIAKKALPAMNKAYSLQPERGEVVRGMMYLHRALEHEKDTEYFKQEVSRLIREGKIGTIVKQP